MFVIYAAIGGGSGLFVVCLFICCCYVRVQGRKRDEEMHSKVKKYMAKNVTSEDKIARFKYGRQSIPLSLPELADNQDDMLKPNQDAGWNGDQSQYQDNLDFNQIEEINTNYNNFAPYGMNNQMMQQQQMMGPRGGMYGGNT